MKFWNWVKDENGDETNELRIDGTIDDERFWGDEVTVKDIADSLKSKSGDIVVWINSPGGNVFAAAQMYNLIKEYDRGKVTVKIDSLAASAATVVAMAGDEVLMSPVAMFMIHNPMTIAMGNEQDMQEAIKTLRVVKDSIVNAYTTKSGKSAKAIAKLMDGENGEGTWMDAKKALANGFIDSILYADADEKEEEKPPFPPNTDPDDPEEDPDDPEKEEEDENLTEARNKAKQQYTDYINSIKRNAHSGYAFRNDAGADEAHVHDAESIEDSGEEDADSVIASEAEQPTADPPTSEATDEAAVPEAGADAPQDKVSMPKPVFDENGFTADGSASYYILADKLDALR